MTSDNAIVAGFGGNGWAEVTNQPLEGAVIDRAFLAAHLLTGSPEQAECAVLEAIASWGPDGSEDELLNKVLHVAVRGAAEDAQSLANEADSPDASLPVALQAVLRLAPLVRQCYVLRVLVRLPRKVCSSLLLVVGTRRSIYMHCAQVSAPCCSTNVRGYRVRSLETGEYPSCF